MWPTIIIVHLPIIYNISHLVTLKQHLAVQMTFLELDLHIGVTLPVYYLRGEEPAPGVAAPRNKELRRALSQYRL